MSKVASLDNFNDKLCFWRCIAVHKGARSDLSTQVRHHRVGIRVYEPELQENGKILWHLRMNPSDKLKNIKMIGIYEGHVFLIKDINKLAKLYACVNSQAGFTKGYVIYEDTHSLQQRKEQEPSERLDTV